MDSVVGKDMDAKVGTEWRPFEILSEPYVVWSFKGFAPVVNIRYEGQTRILFIGSKSLSLGLHPLIARQGDRFMGIKAMIRKDGTGKYAHYEIKEAS